MVRNYITVIQNFLVDVWDGSAGGDSMLVKTKDSEIEGVWLIYDQEEYYADGNILYCRIYIYRNGALLDDQHVILSLIFNARFPGTNEFVRGSFKFSWIGSNLRIEAILDFPVALLWR